jgi:hypothetical protein
MSIGWGDRFEHEAALDGSPSPTDNVSRRKHRKSPLKEAPDMIQILAVFTAPVALALASARYGRDSRNLPTGRNRPTL